MAIKFKGFTYEEVPRFRLAEGRSASDMIRSLRVTVNEMETDPDFLENVPVRVEPYVENLKAHAKELSAIRNKEVEEWPHDLWKWAKQMDLSAVNGRLSPEHFGRFLRLVRGIANAYKSMDSRGLLEKLARAPSMQLTQQQYLRQPRQQGRQERRKKNRDDSKVRKFFRKLFNFPEEAEQAEATWGERVSRDNFIDRRAVKIPQFDNAELIDLSEQFRKELVTSGLFDDISAERGTWISGARTFRLGFPETTDDNTINSVVQHCIKNLVSTHNAEQGPYVIRGKALVTSICFPDSRCIDVSYELQGYDILRVKIWAHEQEATQEQIYDYFTRQSKRVSSWGRLRQAQGGRLRKAQESFTVPMACVSDILGMGCSSDQTATFEKQGGDWVVNGVPSNGEESRSQRIRRLVFLLVRVLRS